MFFIKFILFVLFFLIYAKNIFKIHKIVKKYQTNDISFVFGKFADLYMLKGLSVNTKSFIGIFGI